MQIVNVTWFAIVRGKLSVIGNSPSKHCALSMGLGKKKLKFNLTGVTAQTIIHKISDFSRISNHKWMWFESGL